MFCRSCGANNRDGVKFCSQCGAPLDDPQQGGGMNMNQNMNGGMNPPLTVHPSSSASAETPLRALLRREI